MRLEQLRYLVEISQCNSMSTASEKLHLTPQALSISIKNLEEELGIELVKRTNRGTSLTEKGWRLTILTKKFLEDIELLIRDGEQEFENDLFQGNYTVCSTYGGMNLFLPQLITHFLKKYPKMQIHVDSMPYYSAHELVNNHEVPYAFFEQYVIRGEEKITINNPIVFYPLFRYQLTCQVPMNFPIAKYDSISFEKLFQYPFVETLHRGDNSFPSILQFCNQFEKPPKIYPVDSPSMVKSLVQSGMGVAFNLTLPYQDIDRFHVKNIKNIPVTDDIEIYFGYIKDKDAVLDSTDRAFLNYIDEHLNSILTENVF